MFPPTILVGVVTTTSEGQFIQLSLHLSGDRPYHGNHQISSRRIFYDLLSTAQQMASFIRRIGEKPKFLIRNGYTDEFGCHIEPKPCDPCNVELIKIFTDHLYTHLRAM